MRVLILALAFTLTACSSFHTPSWLHPYHMDIPQGNQVSDEAVAKLKAGMTRQQVRFVLGTPLLTDDFHADRWDYKYRLSKGSDTSADKLLTVYFKGDALVRAELNGKPLPLEAMATGTAP
jgi:outer membrane protein assembly factor BamE